MYLEPGQNMEARACVRACACACVRVCVRVCVCDTTHTEFDIQRTMHHDILL